MLNSTINDHLTESLELYEDGMGGLEITSLYFSCKREREITHVVSL